MACRRCRRSSSRRWTMPRWRGSPRFRARLVVKPPCLASAHGTWPAGRGRPGPAIGSRQSDDGRRSSNGSWTEGEYSLILFDGEFSHAIVKRAKAGDYRSSRISAGPRLNASASGRARGCHAALAAAPAPPAYARVDLIRLQGRVAWRDRARTDRAFAVAPACTRSRRFIRRRDPPPPG